MSGAATVRIDPSLALYYEDDCFADPWSRPETVLLIHGVSESSIVWYGWMPLMARHYRVLRPDLRGFGRSTVPPPGYAWSASGFARDLRALLDLLGVDAVHVVGAKFGGTVAAQLAADDPGRVRTLSLLGALVKGTGTGSRVEVSTYADRVDRSGHAGFAADTQRLRLGSSAPHEQVEWWNGLQASADESVATAILHAAGGVDITGILPRIAAPTLVITTDRNPIHALDWVVTWHRLLPRSDLLVLPGDGYHVAASDPETCAEHVHEFIQRNTGRG